MWSAHLLRSTENPARGLRWEENSRETAATCHSACSSNHPMKHRRVVCALFISLPDTSTIRGLPVGRRLPVRRSWQLGSERGRGPASGTGFRSLPRRVHVPVLVVRKTVGERPWLEPPPAATDNGPRSRRRGSCQSAATDGRGRIIRPSSGRCSGRFGPLVRISADVGRHLVLRGRR